MNSSYSVIVNRLERESAVKYHMIVGFDAVLDHLVNVVSRRDETGDEVYFSSINEFGSYLCTKAGISCCLELKTVSGKIGGNMAILAQAASLLGVKTSCVGTLGDSDSIVYRSLAETCDVYSVAPYGNCTALEFADGKVMLASNAAMQITWDDVIGRLGSGALSKLLSECHMLCLVNWSEMRHSNDIWRSMLDYAPQPGLEAGKYAFFDLSDFSARNTGDVLQCVEIISAYGGHYKTLLGLNANEASLLAGALGMGQRPYIDMGREILQKTGTESVVIHTKTNAYAFDAKGTYEAPSLLSSSPAALTGAGDNFNAGFCYGKLSGFGTHDCIRLGNASAGYYVRYGKSADRGALLSFIRTYA